MRHPVALVRSLTVALIASTLVLVPLAACSSDDSEGGADAGAAEAGGDGAISLPSCAANGFQCQLKGCLSGFVEAPSGYECGSSTGSCCQRGSPTLDSGPPADAKNDG